MKKSVIIKISIFLIIIITLTSSCSKNNSTFQSTTTTLKQTINDIKNETVWSEEIEKDRLTQDISQAENISPSVNLSPAVYNNSKNIKELNGVYPYLEGFSYLDNSTLLPELKEIAETFCKNLSEGKDSSSLFEENNNWEFFVLAEDLKSYLKEKFNFDYIDELSINKEKEIADSNKNTEENKDTEKKIEIKNFSKYIFGKNYDTETQSEMPVRFFLQDNNYFDLILYFTKTNENWKINQVQLLKQNGN